MPLVDSDEIALSSTTPGELGHYHEDALPSSGGRAQPQISARRTKYAMVAIDLACVIVALGLTTLFYQRASNNPVGDIVIVAAASLPFWPIIFAQQGMYQARHLARRVEELRLLVNTVALGVVALAALSVVLGEALSRVWLVCAATAVFVLVSLEREITRRVITRLRREGHMSRRVVVIGGNEEAAELIAALTANPELGYQVAGWLHDADLAPSDGDHPTDSPCLGDTSDALQILRSVGATSIVVATTSVSQETANRVVRDLTREGYYVELTSSMRDIASRRATVRPLGRYPVVCVEPVTTNGWRQTLKRMFDIAVSTLAIVFTLPVTIPAALAIRITSGPGVLFRQTRVGRHGKLFTVYKLRTMVHDAEALLPDLLEQNQAAGPMFKMENDPRVTTVGRFLRKTSIDELPQLFNVLMGPMSLVGPRPALPHEAVQWNDDLYERLRVKPGITGNWQVNGRFTASIEDYQRLDLNYVDNWSLVSDLVILAKTIPAVLRRNGAA